MSVAIKKILYAADVKESALDEAQAYIHETLNADEEEQETEEAWLLTHKYNSWLLNKLSADHDYETGNPSHAMARKCHFIT